MTVIAGGSFLGAQGRVMICLVVGVSDECPSMWSFIPICAGTYTNEQSMEVLGWWTFCDDDDGGDNCYKGHAHSYDYPFLYALAHITMHNQWRCTGSEIGGDDGGDNSFGHTTICLVMIKIILLFKVCKLAKLVGWMFELVNVY